MKDTTEWIKGRVSIGKLPSAWKNIFFSKVIVIFKPFLNIDTKII